jgi:hypothetical protein
MQHHKLEFWADSFHEGHWACEEIAKLIPPLKTQYLKGFIPEFTYQLSYNVLLTCTVFGSYKNWTPLPDKISAILEWGKPDLIIYDPSKDKIILAVEETAAVPTGNQALQRCERIFGSARLKIPFWYLIGEFGIHKDGGVRRDSIWPSILALRLSNIYETPSIVLHYSDAENPEDYSVGEGLTTLFESIVAYIENYYNLKTKESLIETLTPQYQKMFLFINSQWKSIIKYLPDAKNLLDKNIAKAVAEKTFGLKSNTKILENLLVWSKTEDLPSSVLEKSSSNGYINYDPFVVELERLVDEKKAYNLVIGAGSKPQKEKDIEQWVAAQESLWEKSIVDKKPLVFKKLKFSETANGNFHLTTAKNVFYLIDKFKDLDACFKNSFNPSKGWITEYNLPILLFIANSMKPGRIFGDPFTGQLSAYCNIFSKNNAGKKIRLSVAYYPYQVHTQLFDNKNQFRQNKGITIMRELLDFAIFHNGVLVNLKTGAIIC